MDSTPALATCSGIALEQPEPPQLIIFNSGDVICGQVQGHMVGRDRCRPREQGLARAVGIAVVGEAGRERSQANPGRGSLELRGLILVGRRARPE